MNIALGLDTAKGDPTGTWTLTPDDFEAMGRVIGGLGFPTLIVQEGGTTRERSGEMPVVFSPDYFQAGNSGPVSEA